MASPSDPDLLQQILQKLEQERKEREQEQKVLEQKLEQERKERKQERKVLEQKLEQERKEREQEFQILTMQLSELRLSADKSTTPAKSLPPPKLWCGLEQIVASEQPVRLHSPSGAAESIMREELAVLVFTGEPLSQELKRFSHKVSLSHLASLDLHRQKLLVENNLRSSAMAFLPEGVDVVMDKKGKKPAFESAASTCYLVNAKASEQPNIHRFLVPWSCRPELPTRAPPYHAPFFGEIKSTKSGSETTVAAGTSPGTGSKVPPKLFDEAVTYGTLGMLGSFFSGVQSGHRRFFKSPPVALGILAHSFVGYLVALEWIGKIFVSVVSQPFFPGSPEHERAIQSLGWLTSRNYSGEMEEHEMNELLLRSYPEEAGKPKRVIWTAAESDIPSGERSHSSTSNFLKIVRCDGFPPFTFTNMFRVYSALSEAWETSDSPPPASLLRARLLFGQGELCVIMPFLWGVRELGEDEELAGDAADAIVTAIVWLARRNLFYADLRPPNIFIRSDAEDLRAGQDSSSTAYLVDYDDIVIGDSEETVSSVGDFIAALERAAEIDPRAPSYATIGFLCLWPSFSRKLDTAFSR